MYRPDPVLAARIVRFVIIAVDAVNDANCVMQP